MSTQAAAATAVFTPNAGRRVIKALSTIESIHYEHFME
jgi:hypothetical protein